jgi:hypothetical protein
MLLVKLKLNKHEEENFAFKHFLAVPNGVRMGSKVSDRSSDFE